MMMPASEAKEEPADSWRQILSDAVAAQSPLNTHPWRVLQKGPLSIDLFIDTERLLPLLDPTSRQGYLSCGAFIENLEIAAREAGFRADVTLFPTGWPGAAMSPMEPVARIELFEGDKRGSDPLYSCLHTRYTQGGGIQGAAGAAVDRHQQSKCTMGPPAGFCLREGWLCSV